MGKLADVFLQDAGKPGEKPEEKQAGELDLFLIPVQEVDEEICLESQYSFSQVAKGSDRIVIGRINTDVGLEGLIEDLQPGNKLYIPSPRFIAALKQLLEGSCKDTISFPSIREEFEKIYFSTNYHRVSRKHLEIRKETANSKPVYILRNLTERRVNGEISSGMPSVMVYDREKKSSDELAFDKEIVLADGMIINLGYPPNPLVKYPVRLEVSLKTPEEKKRNRTSKMAPFY
jgi:hypothetical protein